MLCALLAGCAFAPAEAIVFKHGNADDAKAAVAANDKETQLGAFTYLKPAVDGSEFQPRTSAQKAAIEAVDNKGYLFPPIVDNYDYAKVAGWAVLPVLATLLIQWFFFSAPRA